jgi:micrococcal nuclease
MIGVAAKLLISVIATFGWVTASTDNKHNVGTIVDVVDGDTIDITTNNITKRVRLIGINTPETKHPTKKTECYGKEASEYMVKLLPKGTKVNLVYDKETTDKYGRVLAYIYVRSNNMFVNLNLVSKGYAKTMTFKPNTLHAYEFEIAQKIAKTNQIGLWNKCK